MRRNRNRFLVEDDIPLPKGAEPRYGKWEFLMTLKKKQSFWFPEAEYYRVRAALNYWRKKAQKEGIDMEFYAEREDGGWRIWRIR